MISKADLAPLNEYKTGKGGVLTLYLDVDQSNVANLNRNFELAFESKIKEAGNAFEEENERRDFDGCVAEVRKVLAAYEPRARGIVIFARPSGLVWMRELNVPVATETYWGAAPHIQRFLEALDEFKPYGVVLTDRSHSRVFTVKLGVLEKHAEIHALQAVRHIKTSGTDHLYSQSHLQRKADEHRLSHLKRVVQVLDHVAKLHPFERLIVAGATEPASELFRLLPKLMKARVVASVSLSANASESKIVEEVLSIGLNAERTIEDKKVERLITASAKGHNAVTGLFSTLDALNSNRVRELVYSQGYSACGSVCNQCDAVFASDVEECQFCGLRVEPVDDLIEAAIAKALAEGAVIEQLRGEAADKLKTGGGIGAFLRY